MRHLALALLAATIAACTPQMQYVYEVPGAVASAERLRDDRPQRIAKEEDYSVWYRAGRYYVIRSKETARTFARTGTLETGKAVPDMGPYGETVVFESDPDDSSVAELLEMTYRETPQLLRKWDNEFFVWKHQGRFFVIGDPVTNDLFAKNHHLPFTKTLFGAGPNGETAVFEVKKNKPDFVAALIERFAETPQLLAAEDGYFVWRYRNRLYVIGSADTCLWFERHLALPNSRALLHAGPDGETVIVEKKWNDPSLFERLTAKFFNPAG